MVIPDYLKYRAYIHGEMKMVQAIFWNNDYTRVTEIRYTDAAGDIESVPDCPLMQSTGFKETGSDRLVFEGDIVEVEYQYGISVCVVEWCNVKYGLILKPIKGQKPIHKPHFRISGKKRITVLGNIYQNPDLLGV